jgi:hypothetical protein
MHLDPVRTGDFLAKSTAAGRESEGGGRKTSCNAWRRWSSDSEGRRRRAPAMELTCPQIRPATPPLPAEELTHPHALPSSSLATMTPPARHRTSNRRAGRPHTTHRVLWRAMQAPNGEGWRGPRAVDGEARCEPRALTEKDGVKLKPPAEKDVAEVDPPGSEVAGGLHGHRGKEEIAMTLLPPPTQILAATLINRGCSLALSSFGAFCCR